MPTPETNAPVCDGCRRLAEYEIEIQRSARLSWEGVTSSLMRLGASRREHAKKCAQGEEL